MKNQANATVHKAPITEIDLAGKEDVPAGTLNMHPGPSGENSVIRWTAPASGSYRVQEWFKGNSWGAPWGDPTTSDVAVLHGASQLFSGYITTYNQPLTFDLIVTVASRDTIDFTVGFGNNGTYSGDATGISGTISAVETHTIDVKPGGFPNSVSLRDQGLLPVAILGATGFDVTSIVPSTIALGGVDLATRGSSRVEKLAYSFEDVNKHGRTDLLALFSIPRLVAAGALTTSTNQLVLTANLDAVHGGAFITGIDSVRVVP